MILFEYDEKKHLKNERELAKAEGIKLGRIEGRAEGKAEGRTEGRIEGKSEQLLRSICRKLKKNKNANQVADELEEDILAIEPLYNFALQFAPDFDENEVCEAWFPRDINEDLDLF